MLRCSGLKDQGPRGARVARLGWWVDGGNAWGPRALVRALPSQCLWSAGSIVRPVPRQIVSTIIVSFFIVLAKPFWSAQSWDTIKTQELLR